VPADIKAETISRLDDRLRRVLFRFTERFGVED
jgi:hypothetical protein